MQQQFTVIVDEFGKKKFFDVNTRLVFDCFYASDFKNRVKIFITHGDQQFELLVVKITAHLKARSNQSAFQGNFFQLRFDHLTSSAEFFASWLDEGDQLSFDQASLEVES